MMRDWLTIIIVLLIIGIVLDGIRRVRLARREDIRLSRRAQKADLDMREPPPDSEFPSGGARVAKVREPDDAKSVNTSLKNTLAQSKTTVGAPKRIPEQVTLNLEEAVPMLMDSVSEEATEDSEEELADFLAPEYEMDQQLEPTLGDGRAVLEEDVLPQEAKPARDNQPTVSTEHQHDDLDERPRARIEEELPEPEEVLIINVMSRLPEKFEGETLLAALVQQKMKLGAMDIFHRHLDENGEGAILFSLANMVVPGTFNLSEMASFTTPGLSLFLSLPLDDGQSIKAYDMMVATARALASALNGELKDENRSVMTLQTIEHGRQRVIEYERKRKLHRSASKAV